MPVLTTPTNKKKYFITASEILYDPLNGETPTTENFGIPGKPGDPGLRNTINHELTNKITEYDAIELYGVDDDFNQMHAKILNPKVGSFIAMGAPIIGGNYIFFKAAVYELEEQNIIVKKCGLDTWTQNNAAVAGNNGGNDEYLGLWGPHMNTGAFDVTAMRTALAMPYYEGSNLSEEQKAANTARTKAITTARHGAADFTKRLIGLFKVIGYKNVSVSMD